MKIFSIAEVSYNNQKISEIAVGGLLFNEKTLLASPEFLKSVENIPVGGVIHCSAVFRGVRDGSDEQIDADENDLLNIKKNIMGVEEECRKLGRSSFVFLLERKKFEGEDNENDKFRQKINIVFL